MYPSPGAWRESFDRIPERIEALTSRKGRAGESSEALLETLRARDRLNESFGRLYVYAHLYRDQNTGDPEGQALAERIAALRPKVGEAESWIPPEILALPEERIAAFLDENEELRLYRHDLDDLLRLRPHTLSPEEEKLLALSGNVAAGPRNAFTMLNNADLRFPAIRDEEGREVEVTKGRFSLFMESRERRVRRDAYEALLGTYRKFRNVFAALLSGSVTKDIFYARARGYDNCLERALDGGNIPRAVFDTTLRAVQERPEPLRRYLDLRRRILGLEELRPWDLFVPLFPEGEEKIPYEEAVALVREGLRPLGPAYGAALDEGLGGGWIDVYENEGKRSGAYSWGAYGAHPYVLLNWQGTLDDVFTLAHELGHALHTRHSSRRQPYVYADYSIFTAEVASTTNEALLMHHLLETTEDRNRKLHLLNQRLDQIRGTVYTQVLFAEFERRIHEAAEREEPITAEALGGIFTEAHETLYGDRVERDELHDVYWARIPHFYTGFYVYQYATGFAAATALSQRILREGEEAVRRYIGFLEAGGSDYPIEILRRAGVDMTSPEPIEETVRLFDRLLDEVEALL